MRIIQAPDNPKYRSINCRYAFFERPRTDRLLTALGFTKDAEVCAPKLCHNHARIQDKTLVVAHRRWLERHR
jgi:hypothetical protein